MTWEENEYAKMMYTKGLPFYEEWIKQLGFTKMESILDLGCGPGQWTIALAKHNQSCYGVDTNRDFLAIAQTKRDKNNVTNAIFLQENAEALTFPNESFDGVFCHAVLQYTHPKKTIAEAVRVLKPNGRLYVAASTPWYFANIFIDGIHYTEPKDSIYAIRALGNTLKKQLGFPATTTTFFTKHELRSLFEKKGLYIAYSNEDMSWMGSFDKFIRKGNKTVYRKFPKMWHGKPHLYEIVGVKQ